MDELFDDLLRSAGPGTVRRGDPLSSRGQRELEKYRIMERELVPVGQSEAQTRNRRNPALVTSSISIVGVLFLVVVAALLNSAPTFALTPPVLDINVQASRESSSALFRELGELRRQFEQREISSSPPRTIRAQTWSRNTVVGDDGTVEQSVHEPRWYETSFELDGTVHERIVAADPFPGQRSENLPEPGTVITDTIHSPGSWWGEALNELPSDPLEVGDFLAEFAGVRTLSAPEAISEIRNLLMARPVNGEEEAVIIEYLATLDQIEVSGSVVDRLGRPGIVFNSGGDPSEFEELLVVSSENGRILASESIFVGEALTGIPSPSVAYYVAWDR